MTAPADLAEVRAALALVAQATPGPLTVSRVRPCIDGPDGRIIACCCSDDSWQINDANAAAIVALHNAAPAIAAVVDELERLRAETARQREHIRAGADAVRSANASTTEIGCRLDDAGERIAALNRQICRLVSGQEIEGDRLCQHLAELALLAADRAAARAEIASLEVDVKRHLKSFAREREIAMKLDREVRSLRAELEAACAVPSDVEAAIASLDAAAYRRGRDPAKVGGPPSASAAARVNARAGLRAAIAKAIADAEERGRAQGRADLDAELRRAVELRAQAVREAHSGALAGLEEAARLELEAAGLASYGDSPETTAREAHIFAVRCVKRAVAAEARLREIEAAAPATVGGLLATINDRSGSFVEWYADGDWYSYGSLLKCWSATKGRWQCVDSYAMSWPEILPLPARIVPANQDSVDPADRGPIAAAAPTEVEAAAKETDDAR